MTARKKKRTKARVTAKQKISPFLWYDHEAEEAAKFYVSLFKDSRIKEVSRYGEEGPGPAGQAMAVSFQLAGCDFTALNGGPHYKFTEAISLYVDCKDQREVDRLWSKLTAGGGSEAPCGWLKDKYGLSWQIVPSVLPEMLHDDDAERAGRVMQAMLSMKKIDVSALKAAYAGK